MSFVVGESEWGTWGHRGPCIAHSYANKQRVGSEMVALPPGLQAYGEVLFGPDVRVVKSLLIHS